MTSTSPIQGFTGGSQTTEGGDRGTSDSSSQVALSNERRSRAVGHVRAEMHSSPQQALPVGAPSVTGTATSVRARDGGRSRPRLPAAAPPTEARGAEHDPDRGVVRFSILDPSAKIVVLELFDRAVGVRSEATGEVVLPRINQKPLRMQRSTANPGVWWIDIPVDSPMLRANGIDLEAGDALYYGYRKAWRNSGRAGPFDASHLERMLLPDPLSRQLSHDWTSPELLQTTGWSEEQVAKAFATHPDARFIDTAAFAPKSVFAIRPMPSFGSKPTRAFADEIIAEVHPRGFTMCDPSVPEAERGTLAGLRRKVKALAETGYTAIKLLPTAEFNDQHNDGRPEDPQANYWGYMTNLFGAVNQRYAADQSPGGPEREFVALVEACHEAGLKVYVDMVYNHPGEGGHWQDTPGITNIFGVKGYNANAILLTHDGQHEYSNSGCGGDLNMVDPAVQELIVSTMKRWIDEYGVDGARFDLMAILYNVARSGGYEFDRDAPVMRRLRSELGVRPADGGEGADLYGEPWTAIGGQIQGQTPATEGELNDFFRTKARQWVNQPEKVTPGELADIMTGSAGRFEGGGGRPFNSVNLVANHDGYTVFGTVCNTDPDHHAWDHGGDPVAQRQAWRNLVTLQLLAYGVPQLPAETDRMWEGVPGNHNPYNIDADANYTPWNLSEEQRQAQTFLSQLMHFRQEHPELRPRDYASAGEQVEFYTPDGVPTATLEDSDQGRFWSSTDNHWLAYSIRGQDGRRLLVATNKHWEGRAFQLPPPADGRQWRVVLDTSARNEGDPASGNFFAAGQRPIAENNAYDLADRSIVVLSED